MIRQLGLRQIALARQAIVAQPTRSFTYSITARKSIVDTAKDVLDKANKKTGEFLAGTIETTENVVPSTENVKQAAEEVNKKTGEVLADGIQKAENVTEDVKKTASRATDDAENLADKAKYAAEEVKGKAADLAEEAEFEVKETAHDIREKTDGLTEDSRERKRVAQNAEGYKNLQDKGAKLESEQLRADDGI